MSTTSLNNANLILHKGYKKFCNELAPFLESMENNANIESYTIERVHDMHDTSHGFIHLNIENNCNWVPAFDNYHSLEDLYELVKQLFIDNFWEFDNFFPSIWIYWNKIDIEFYWFEENSNLTN